MVPDGADALALGGLGFLLGLGAFARAGGRDPNVTRQDAIHGVLRVRNVVRVTTGLSRMMREEADAVVRR